MADPRLPAPLQAAIAELLAASGNVARRAGAQSEAYRASRPSADVVADGADLAAYVAVRLPATYAAIAEVLEEIGRRAPGFAPKSLLDAGTGPGTAAWAATAAFGSLQHITLVDHNRSFLAMAGRLAAASPAPALAAAERLKGTLLAPPPGERRFDLVVTGYALTELPDHEVVDAALRLWKRCDGVLAIIEPGRTRDYQRLMMIRTALFEAGATIVGPCPHERACPLPAGDWCHFSVRLPRSRAHVQAKGASLGYEDEKFSYLAVARPAIAARPVAARVVRQPVVRKFEVELPLCGTTGLEQRAVARRDPAFKVARKLDWGDGLD